jgi:glycosyltransferase involved in cell wall biosynthesis
MNILVIHEVDWLKKVVFEIHSISEQMSRLGHRVCVIDYEDTWQREGCLGLGTLRTRRYEDITRTGAGTGVGLIRPGFIRLPGLSRLSAAASHYREIGRVIRREKIDIILLYSVPTNGPAAVHLARKYGIPVVFRAIDILYRLVRYPVLRPPTRFLERWVYRRADRILAIAPRYARYVTRMGAPAEKVKQVLMPVDTELFRPAPPDTELQGRWGIRPEDAVILFIGTLFPFSGLDIFLRHFPEVVAAVPEARLLIVGDGPQRHRLEGIIAKTGLKERVIITGFQPYEDMPGYINLASVCINTFLNTPETEDIFPGKILQYLAGGCATAATPLKGIVTLAPARASGIVYAENEAMAAAVIDLLRSPGERQERGRLGVDFIRRQHGYENIARQFEAELLAAIREKQGEAGGPGR